MNEHRRLNVECCSKVAFLMSVNSGEVAFEYSRIKCLFIHLFHYLQLFI